MVDIRAAYKSGQKTGTTTSAYVEVIRIDTRGYGVQGKLLALISNLDSSNTMYYKIDGYPFDESGANSGLSVAIKGETSIAAATTITSTDVDKGYAAVVISLKQNSGAGKYQVEYVTY